MLSMLQYAVNTCQEKIMKLRRMVDKFSIPLCPNPSPFHRLNPYPFLRPDPYPFLGLTKSQLSWRLDWNCKYENNLDVAPPPPPSPPKPIRPIRCILEVTHDIFVTNQFAPRFHGNSASRNLLGSWWSPRSDRARSTPGITWWISWKYKSFKC